MKRIIGSIAAATLLLLAACNSGGSDYVGKWVNVKSDEHTLVIDRNGESFIIRDTHPSSRDGKVRTENIPATYKDGMLQVQTELGAVSIVIDKASGNLTNGKAEYTRAP